MKMPSRYAFDRDDEAERARQLHREQDASRRGGYKMVRVSVRTHVLMMKLKQREGRHEWPLDAILYQLLLQELASAENVYTGRSHDADRRDPVYLQTPTSRIVDRYDSE